MEDSVQNIVTDRCLPMNVNRDQNIFYSSPIDQWPIL